MSSILIHNLQNPALYPHPVKRFAVFETHSSWVITTGEYAYKIKKPVNFGFLDYSSLAKRRENCEKELKLNQPLAREIYLEVVPIYGDELKPNLSGPGEIIEYAVKMRQFSQQDLLSQLLQHHHLDKKVINDLAEVLVDFHQHTDVAAKDSFFGTPEHAHKPVMENFSETIALLKDNAAIRRLQHLATLTEQTYHHIKPIMIERKQQGFIRRCHSDAHLNNVVLLHNKPVLFDRIEFNEDFMWTDTMADLGFLLMDLDEHRQPALARLLRNHYMELSGDYHGLQVLPYYCAYRAMVRAKVDQIRLLQEDLSSIEGAELSDHYRESLKLVENYLSPKKPELIIMFGFAGSGKSTVAKKLVTEIDAVQIRSDAERKRLAGVQLTDDTTADVIKGLYTTDNTERVYQYLLQLARYTLNAGYTAIIDATFLKRSHRQLFADLAAELNIPFKIIQCTAPPKVLQERIIDRNAKQHDISNSTLDVLQHQLESYDPLTVEELKITNIVDIKS